MLVVVPTNNALAMPTPPSVWMEPVVMLLESVVLSTVNVPVSVWLPPMVALPARNKLRGRVAPEAPMS